MARKCLIWRGKQGNMASIAQFDGKRRNAPTRQGSPLTPELKEFIDRVIIPCLVKEYLALNVESGGNFARSTAAPILEGVRP